MPFFRSHQNNNNDNVKYSYTYHEYGSNGKLYTINTASIFINDNEFNYPLVIGNNVNNFYSMLRNCTNFNQNLYFRSSSICSQCLENCSSFGADIFFINDRRNLYPSITGLLTNKNLSKRVNVHFPSFVNKYMCCKGIFNGANQYIFANMDNGFYNEYWNLYIYNNYEETI